MSARLITSLVGTLSILAVAGRAQPIRADLAPAPNPSASPSLVTVVDSNSGAPTGAPGVSAPQAGGSIFEQVAKMIHAGADPAVIKSFIQNWASPFSVTADDILRLHDSGASSDLLTALIHRSAELQAQVAANTPPPPPTTTAPNIYSVPQVGTTDTSGYSYASPYPAYSYSYLYPYYDYSYYWGWPYYFSWWYPWPYYWGYYGGHYHNYYAYHGYHGHGGYGHPGYGYNYGHGYNHGPVYSRGPSYGHGGSYGGAHIGGNVGVGHYGGGMVGGGAHFGAGGGAHYGGGAHFGGGGAHFGGGGGFGGRGGGGFGGHSGGGHR